jgi:uncharacterized protein
MSPRLDGRRLFPPALEGGVLTLYGDADASRVVLFLGRDNFITDDSLVARVIADLTRRGHTIVHYEPRWHVSERFRQQTLFPGYPRWLKLILKWRVLLASPRKWRHFSAAYRHAVDTPSHRHHMLRAIIRHLGPDREVAIFARSAGGRFATQIADTLALRCIVCLAYPFKHPDLPPEPERTAHLAQLKTPLLIIQGTGDGYGGRDLATQYAVSPTTQLRFAPTNHNFVLNEAEWAHTLDAVHGFITAPTAPVSTHGWA